MVLNSEQVIAFMVWVLGFCVLEGSRVMFVSVVHVETRRLGFNKEVIVQMI
jgi:hypothetical protein